MFSKIRQFIGTQLGNWLRSEKGRLHEFISHEWPIVRSHAIRDQSSACANRSIAISDCPPGKKRRPLLRTDRFKERKILSRKSLKIKRKSGFRIN